MLALVGEGYNLSPFKEKESENNFDRIFKKVVVEVDNEFKQNPNGGKERYNKILENPTLKLAIKKARSKMKKSKN